MSAHPVFTIGHSNHSLERFLKLLHHHGVTALADVRSSPWSNRYPHYQKEPLRAALDEAGIAYVFLGRELGARPRDDSVYVQDQVDLERLARTGPFREGVERVIRGSESHLVALLCAEREPLNCHRTILVARHLVAAGLEVQHILADGGLESHGELEGRLVAELDLEEPDLFLGRDEVIAEAYRLHGRRIAHRRPPPS